MHGYSAGLIDGEGYIGIQESGGSFQVRLKIQMTDKGLSALRLMERLHGGKLEPATPGRDERARATYTWRLTGKAAALVIAEVRPMLLVKAAAADIALEFQAMVDASPRLPNGRATWTSEMRERAVMLRARIQDANRTGPDPRTPDLPKGSPVAVYQFGWWWEPESDLFGLVEFKGRLPTSGRMVAGHVYELPTAAREASSSLLPTPVADHSRGLAQPGSDYASLPNVALSLMPTPRATDGTKGGPNQRGSSGDLMLPSAVMLLPTPAAHDSGNSPEVHLRKKPGRTQVTSLQVIVDHGLLSTGGRMHQPSVVGNASSDDPPPHLPSPDPRANSD